MNYLVNYEIEGDFMKILRNSFNSDLNIRFEKDFPVKGIEFIDINPLIMQKDVFKEMINLFTDKLKEYNIDYIVMPEARGFVLGSVVADRLNVGCIPVRKKGKLPPSTIELHVEYQKEYGKDILEFPKLVNDSYKNKKFYIIDDIYATGNTVKAIKEGIESLNGIVVGCGSIINIKELNNNKDLFSLIDVNEG